MKRVLYVSKNVVPPWNDGSKNLVRDLANHVKLFAPSVMAHARTADLAAHVAVRTPYREHASKFAPGATENLRVLWHLMRSADEDLRHYVFAPNARSSSAARWLKRVRSRLPVVQTIASAPAAWERALFFGDRVVAQSAHSQAKADALGLRTEMVWPCAAPAKVVSLDEIYDVRDAYGLGREPIALYAGDYEVSSGSRTMATAAAALRKAGMQVVFACRAKTARAAAVQAEVMALHAKSDAIHLGEVKNMHALLNAVSVLVFPVDNLWGKVDLPLVLLEALSLGKPIVVAGGGPLAEIPTAVVVPPQQPDAILPAVLEAGKVPVAACKEAYQRHFRPEVAAQAYERIYQDLLQ